MNNLITIKSKPKIQQFNLNWQNNAAVQTLLDVVVEVMAEEYIETVRNNEEVFSAPETENTFSLKRKD